MKGYVYILRPNLTINGQPIIKIGMTRRSVEQRVRQLSTGSPAKFEILYSIKVEDAKSLEKSLHKRFSQRRVQQGGGTEYFQVEASEVIAEIERIAEQVSKERAEAAFSRELQYFKKQIGVYQFEKNIGYATISTIILFLIGFGLPLWRLWGSLSLGLDLLIGLPIATFIGGLIEAKLTSVYILPRFGSRIADETARLKMKYPLAHQSVRHSPSTTK